MQPQTPQEPQQPTQQSQGPNHPPQHPAGDSQAWSQPQQPPSGYASYPPVPAPTKRHRKLWITLGSIAVVLIVIIVSASVAGNGGTKVAASANGAATVTPDTSSPATSPDKQPADAQPADDSGSTENLAIGTTITVSDSDGNSTDVTVNSVKIRTRGCGDSFTNPDKGNEYVVVEVTYDQTKGVGSYNPLDWSLVTSSGDEYDGLGVFAECKPELSSSNTLHGKRHGNVVFETPKALKHGQIIYTASILSDSESSWKF